MRMPDLLNCRSCGAEAQVLRFENATDIVCEELTCPEQPWVHAKTGAEAARMWNLSQAPETTAPAEDVKPSLDRAALQQIRDIMLGLHDAPEVASADQTQKAPQLGEEPSVSGSVLTTSDVNEALRAHLWGDASPLFPSVPDRDREVG